MRILVSIMIMAGLVSGATGKDFTLTMPCDIYLEAHAAGILSYIDDPILAYAESKKILKLGSICTIADYVTKICAEHPHHLVRQVLDEVDEMYKADRLPPVPACGAEILHLPSLSFLR